MHFFHEKAFENVVWKMAAILSWPWLGEVVNLLVSLSLADLSSQGDKAAWPNTMTDSSTALVMVRTLIFSWLLIHKYIWKDEQDEAEQNGQHFGGTIFKRISFNLFESLIQFHWNMFMRVELMISQHQFRWWLGTEQATNHYLNQCWQRSEATRFH